MLKRVQTSTLVQVAAGTFLAGATGLYLAQKSMQYRVRSLTHYQEAFKIIGSHEAAQKLLGPPIQVGAVDFSDRRRNYVDNFDSKLHIPVAGTLSSGYVNVVAVRSVPTDGFETKLVELETDDLSVVIYDNPDATSPSNTSTLTS
uniref:Cytochrome oxidase assembly protein 1 n=1 Tax=Panagrellus redivivus TaxID=6233 RepID=A0A7E4W168_PANRE